MQAPGLYYPMIVAGITFVVGSLLLRESRNVKIWEEVGGAPNRDNSENVGETQGAA